MSSKINRSFSAPTNDRSPHTTRSTSDGIDQRWCLHLHSLDNRWRAILLLPSRVSHWPYSSATESVWSRNSEAEQRERSLTTSLRSRSNWDERVSWWSRMSNGHAEWRQPLGKCTNDDRVECCEWSLWCWTLLLWRSPISSSFLVRWHRVAAMSIELRWRRRPARCCSLVQLSISVWPCVDFSVRWQWDDSVEELSLQRCTRCYSFSHWSFFSRVQRQDD